MRDYSQECAVCGQRRGLHRINDEVCQNPGWVAGNGQPQWATNPQWRFTSRLDQRTQDLWRTA